MSSQSLKEVLASELSSYKAPYCVLFTMKGCGWCTQIKETFKDVLKKNNNLIPCVEVVMNDNKEFVMKQGIQGFPELRKYTTTGFKSFDGPRTSEKIALFLKNVKEEKEMNSLIPSIPAQELSLFNVCKSYDVLYTMKGCGWCTKIKEILQEVLKNKDLVPLVEIVMDDNKEFVMKQGIQGFPELRKYSKAGFKSFDGARTPTQIETFLKA